MYATYLLALPPAGLAATLRALAPHCRLPRSHCARCYLPLRHTAPAIRAAPACIPHMLPRTPRAHAYHLLPLPAYAHPSLLPPLLCLRACLHLHSAVALPHTTYALRTGFAMTTRTRGIRTARCAAHAAHLHALPTFAVHHAAPLAARLCVCACRRTAYAAAARAPWLLLRAARCCLRLAPLPRTRGCTPLAPVYRPHVTWFTARTPAPSRHLPSACRLPPRRSSPATALPRAHTTCPLLLTAFFVTAATAAAAALFAACRCLCRSRAPLRLAAACLPTNAGVLARLCNRSY